jgi:hypothetical protein
VVWLLRRDSLGRDGRLKRDAAPTLSGLRVPGLLPGRYRIQVFDTEAGVPKQTFEAEATEGGLAFTGPPFVTDIALAIRRV